MRVWFYLLNGLSSAGTGFPQTLARNAETKKKTDGAKFKIRSSLKIEQRVAGNATL
jgi:hypothetical protein